MEIKKLLEQRRSQLLACRGRISFLQKEAEGIQAKIAELEAQANKFEGAIDQLIELDSQTEKE